ncbi:TPA: ABC transporter ATP-binding protein, partial [Staphylococcus aureus]
MLSIKHLTKIYSGNKKAVDDISLDIQSGEFIAFIGTSGSGKTTALRMINRMIEATEGQIEIDGKDVRSMNPVELRRNIGYVIQQIGLMPHMTIKENIVLVPKLLKWTKEEKDKRAKELIKLVDLPESFLERYPAELSGGQQQRIGVVRALAAEQDIILMDEPFGALDPITRDTLQDLVKTLQRKLGKTFIFVTHDMDEA